MKHLLLTFFTWWNSDTWGTRFFTWRKGEFVGTDDFGNKYYKERGGKRRWVIYKNLAEASQIPAGWHGWMHYRTDTPPTESGYVAREWEIAHSPNLTGTPNAYRPKGSILTPEKRPEVTGDYHAWTPGE
ncbi:NADH:ubiquinone oxidoreductase subunit NDUFA12 [Pseudovibrio ascidiaceicola]|jgi:NADH:ubiquinone oxidoreductase subunit|uniref:NADH:ubiquinone oxidoreductase subunit NDUFA12 n=1 Tax=Pseudovibrio TaxID=258255 RepID=UPI00070B0FB3|nr:MULTISPECIES: NADH:ubiquinone oxidoreductase subunit NDUFA12 [Pseudovibrio]KZK82956.1 NADH dehydrogenase [Pseudovibrio sp. Ad13]KZK85708.1 NADH dehydrogenase [Pseudovibrio sp. Ad46]KZK97878.1 NADH dehydrogenase [Pseudovibrio sp. Ad5]KZL10646.1 NADH dehydrogenase [Pseudovibrio sp. Ad26]KZL23618.1 NADH dehydrogenase [Pseudovibrio sp. Ad37]